MGWCHEFGAEIETGCGHPMVAGSTACSCAECGTLCKGRFEGGCEAVWARGPRLDAPGRPANYAAKAMFEPTAGGVAPATGASERGTGAAAAHSTPAVVYRATPGPEADLGKRLAHLEAAITRLADQVARQSERQITMERHLADFGKVLGQLGVETEDRLELVERVLDDLTASSEHPPSPVPQPQVPAGSSGVAAHSGEFPASHVVRLRPVSDDTGSGDDMADLADGYRAHRSP